MPMLDSAECDRSSPASLEEREGSAIVDPRNVAVERLNGEKDALAKLEEFLEAARLTGSLELDVGTQGNPRTIFLIILQDNRARITLCPNFKRR